MKNTNLFDIVTLSDNNHTSLGEDPVIGASTSLLKLIFPNLFFGGRNAQQIAEDEKRSMEFHKAAFYREHGIRLPNDVVVAVLRPGWDRGENGAQLWDRIINRFYNENKQALEDAKAGIGPLFGSAPGGVYSPNDFSAAIPYIFGAIALVMILKKK